MRSLLTLTKVGVVLIFLGGLELVITTGAMLLPDRKNQRR